MRRIFFLGRAQPKRLWPFGGSPRVSRRAGVAGAIAAAAGIAIAITAFAATLPPSTFEIEGNLIVDTSGNKDWANAPNLKTAFDKPTGQTDDSFGQGTKEDTAVPTVVNGSIPNNKSDLKRFYVSSESIGSNDFLYLAWERVQEPSGTTNMDFEFNQSTTVSSNGVTPERTAGDLLVRYDLARGGTVPTITLQRWVTSGNPGTVCDASNSVPCWGLEQALGGGVAIGAVNSAPVTDPIDPTHPGQPNPGPLSARTFGEAAINLTAANIPPACPGFAGAYLKSRSSDSFTAEMKDFIAPISVNISRCAPVGIKVHKTSTTGGALAGVGFELLNDVDQSGTKTAGDELLSTCSTNSSGDCSFADQSGTGAFHYVVHEVAPPNGFNGGPDQPVTGTFGTTRQDFTVGFQNSPLPGTINILKVDDVGTKLQGAQFTLFQDAAPTGGSLGAEDNVKPAGVAPNPCTTGSQGTCQFTSVPLGEYWVKETLGVPGYDTAAPQHVTIGLGTAPGQGQTIDLTFVDPRRHRIIVVVCHQGTNTLHSSDVTIDSITKQSLPAPPSGMTEQQLCGTASGQLGSAGAVFSGKPHGSRGATIDIPAH
jgi:hypothetical protein